MVQSDWLLGGPLFLIETSQSFRGLLWRSIICSLHAFNIFYMIHTIIHGMLSNIYFIHAQVHTVYVEVILPFAAHLEVWSK